MPEHEDENREESRETYSYTLPPRVATKLAVFAAQTGQNKSRALEEIIECGVVTARALRGERVKVPA